LIISLPHLNTAEYKRKQMYKVSVFIVKHRAMKTHGEVEIRFQAVLTSELSGGQWEVRAVGN
jgi:hypothetical protein